MPLLIFKSDRYITTRQLRKVSVRTIVVVTDKVFDDKYTLYMPVKQEWLTVSKSEGRNNIRGAKQERL